MKFFLSSPSLFSLMPLLMIIMSLISRLSFKHLITHLSTCYIYPISIITAFSSILATLIISLGHTFIIFVLEYSNSLLASPPVQHSCCCHINLFTAPFQSCHSSQFRFKVFHYLLIPDASPLCYSFYFFLYFCIYGLAFSTTILPPSLPVKILVIL